MTTRIGLGVPLPLLAPATALWATPFAALYLILQNRIVYHRLSTKTYMGDTIDASRGTKDPLYLATRGQVNFIENVPFALVLALLAELNGANRKYINYGLGVLFGLRVAHCWGLTYQNTSKAALGGRAAGYYGTQAVMASFIGYIGYLVSGYWKL